jgi:NAD(P)-dependent dehydrogenase (short-subunit alcohol dehydrogenase family)
MEPTATMQGKVCLVTGATSGIGLVTARELARSGAHVVLAGRNPTRCADAVRHVQEQTGSRNVESLIADLSSRQQVRDLARQFRERHSRLDVLVNNAGGISFTRRETVDGLEMTFAVNHLAYFLLTLSLLDLLRASAPARIVNVASAAHRRAVLDFDDLMGKRHYGGWQAYCRSKLANLLFNSELARRLAGTGVTANALHPGWVATNFGAGGGWPGRLLLFVAGCFALSSEQGARTVVYLASSPEVTGVTGGYFVRERPRLPSLAARDENAARQLWQVSLELAELPPDVL